jgi:K+-sensing histidine kinase KdpD
VLRQVLRGNKRCFTNRRNTNDLAKTARSSRIAAIWLDAPLCHLRISNTLGPVPGNCRPGALCVFFLVVAAVSRLWGPGPGLFATLLGGLATWYFLLEPQFSFAFSRQHDVITLIAYFAVAIAISFLPQASSKE